MSSETLKHFLWKIFLKVENGVFKFNTNKSFKDELLSQIFS
jgi:hypothetical protein